MGMYEQIARNKRRTFVMLAVFVLLIAAVAVALGYFFQAGVAIVPIAIVIAIAMAWTSYFASDRIALAASRAKPADGPEYARYHNLVEGLCIAAGLPKPRLYVVEDPAPNARITGSPGSRSGLVRDGSGGRGSPLIVHEDYHGSGSGAFGRKTFLPPISGYTRRP
jgi:heat shock protein HtpX